MTRRTALVIQNKDNDIRCEPYGQHEETEKWAGMVSLYRNGSLHEMLLTSEPKFDSSNAAVIAMQDVVKQIRSTNLLS